MYYLVFFILFYFSIIEVVTKQPFKLWFNIAYVLMLFMVMFRYQQLTDYPAYEYLYDYPEHILQDPLFSMIEVGFNAVGIGFKLFIALIGLISMGLAYPFFARTCSGSIISLFIFYCYAFLILPMSAMRQGICLSILLSCYSLLQEHKMVRFYLIALAGVFIHVSMLIVFVIGLTYRKRFFNESFVPWCVLGFTLFALVTPDLSAYIPEALQGRSTGEIGENRTLQIVLRALLILPVFIYKPEYHSDGYIAKAICIVGYCMYCVLAFSPTISGRMEFYFRVFFCLFISHLVFVEEKRYLINSVLFSVIFINSFLFFKNINSFISQGDYKENVTMLNFPYISIFNTEELQNYK